MYGYCQGKTVIVVKKKLEIFFSEVEMSSTASTFDHFYFLSMFLGILYLYLKVCSREVTVNEGRKRVNDVQQRFLAKIEPGRFRSQFVVYVLYSFETTTPLKVGV